MRFHTSVTGRRWTVAVLLLAAGAVLPGAAPAAPAVYFTSDRASATPGVIESLAPGTKPHELTRPPYGTHLLAVARAGDAIAATTDEVVGALVLSRADGSRRRVIRLASRRTQLLVAFSPDGSRLVATWEASGGFPVALVNVGSGAVQRLGGAARRCVGYFAWSGDGRLLSCQDATQATGTLVFDTAGRERFSMAGGRALWSRRNLLALAQGSQTRVVDDRGHTVHRFSGLALGWSPDGRVLALSRPGALVLASARTGRPLRTIAGPRSWLPYPVAGFTPDGTAYAYEGPHGPLLLPVAGGGPRHLPSGLFEGTWSPGGRLAWLQASGANVTVEVGDRRGAHAKPAGTFPFDGHADAYLAWPGTGTRVLYEWSHRGHLDLWRVASDGSGLQQLTRTVDVSGPAFNPDRTRLAYARASFSDSLCGYCDRRIVLADPQGLPVAALPSKDVDAAPSWSPDGTRLAVEHGVNGELDVVALAGGAHTVLTTGGQAPAWSPDGGTIAWLAGAGVVAAAPEGGGQPTPLPLPAGIEVSPVSWAPDGRSVAYSTATGVYVVAVDGSSAPRLVATATVAGRPSYSPDGSQLVFAASVADTVLRTRNLFVVNVDGSGLHSVAPSPYIDAEPVFGPG